MRTATGRHEFNRHDLAFHHAVAELSGNKAMLLIQSALVDLLAQALDDAYIRVKRRSGAGGTEESVANHAAIADAIIRGDPADAAAAMLEHFEYSAAYGSVTSPTTAAAGIRSRRLHRGR